MTVWSRFLRRGTLIVVIVLVCLSAISAAGTAQDVQPGAQPPTPVGGIPDNQSVVQSPLDLSTETIAYPITVDYSTVCQNFLANTLPSSGAQPLLVPNTTLQGYTLADTTGVLTAQLQLPPGSYVQPIGANAWVQTTSGAVVLVACGSDLVFDLTRYDNTQFVLPAGVGLVVDSSLAGGVFLSLDDMDDWALIFQVGEGASSTIDLDVEFGTYSEILCFEAGCLPQSEVDFSVDGTEVPGTTTGGGPCAAIRCWSK